MGPIFQKSLKSVVSLCAILLLSSPQIIRADDPVACPPLQENKAVCDLAASDVQKILLGKEIVRAALIGNIAAVNAGLKEYRTMIQSVRACRPELKCEDLSYRETQDFSGGWVLHKAIGVRTMFDGACGVDISTNYTNGSYEILGIGGTRHDVFSRLKFRLPSIECGSGDKSFDRTIVLSERGIVVADGSSEIPVSIAKVLPTKTLYTPQFSVLPSGRGRFILSSGVFVDIDPVAKRVVDSNVLDPAMFTQEHCTASGNRRVIVPKVQFQPNGRRLISSVMDDAGSTKDETKLNAYFRKLRREFPQ